MRKTTRQVPLGKRLLAVMCAGALAAATMGAPLAFADNAGRNFYGLFSTNKVATAGDDANHGATTLKVMYIDTNAHMTDEDGFESLNNIALKYPSQLNYVVNHAGRLVGPTVQFSNEAEHGLAIRGIKVESIPDLNFNIEAFGEEGAGGTAPTTTKENSVMLKLGKTAGDVDIANHLSKENAQIPEYGFSAKELSTLYKTNESSGEITDISNAWAMSYKGSANNAESLSLTHNKGWMQNITDNVSRLIDLGSSTGTGVGVPFATISWIVAPSATPFMVISAG